MKGYKIFIVSALVLLVLYIIAEVNKPEQTDWSISFSATKKTPYGAYILYHELKNIFSSSDIITYREPLYNKLHKHTYPNTAFVLLSTEFNPGDLDIKEALAYVENGNYMFISAQHFSKTFLDTLGLAIKTASIFNRVDSSSNFVNAALKTSPAYTVDKASFGKNYFEIQKTDSVTVLGVNGYYKPNFVRVDVGDGAFFIHSDPFCFTNYYLLHNNNSEYVSKALSYLPSDIKNIFWTEYGKLNDKAASTPLRFFLSNIYLSWALWLAIIGLLLFVLFEMKRKQRIIPIMDPLKNTTLDFVTTVANVYFNQKNNAGIANKKIMHWMEFVRQRFYLSTQQLDKNFVEQLAKKSSVDKSEIEKIIDYYSTIQNNNVSDTLLIQINNIVDDFYKQSQ